jgi:orotate phosphoribosyltransferase
MFRFCSLIELIKLLRGKFITGTNISGVPIALQIFKRLQKTPPFFASISPKKGRDKHKQNRVRKEREKCQERKICSVNTWNA